MRGEVVLPARERNVDELLVVAEVLGQLEEALVVVVPLEEELLLEILLGLDVDWGRGGGADVEVVVGRTAADAGVVVVAARGGGVVR